MVELLKSYENVSRKVMNHILAYHAERESEHFEKYGDWRFNDDSDVAHLLNVSEDEEEEASLVISSDEEEPPIPTQQRASQSKETVEEVEAKLVQKIKRLNEIKSKEPGFVPCVLSSPLRIKDSGEEIYLDSISKLRTDVLKKLCWMVIGSTHFLEQFCYREIQHILSSRKGEDPSLDRKRRETLNAYPGRRFKLERGVLKFRIFVYGKALWMHPTDVKLLSSNLIKQYIDEIEDDAFLPEEKAVVEKLKESLREALNREDAARQKRRAQSQAK
jgi:hypothetical protein